MWPGKNSLICINVVLFLGVAFYVFGYHIISNDDQYFANTLNCSREMAMLNREKASQDDKRLIYAIKTCYMESPSKLPYSLKQPYRQSYAQFGQDEFIDNVLYHKVSLFFVIYPTKMETQKEIFSVT